MLAALRVMLAQGLYFNSRQLRLNERGHLSLLHRNLQAIPWLRGISVRRYKEKRRRDSSTS